MVTFGIDFNPLNDTGRGGVLAECLRAFHHGPLCEVLTPGVAVFGDGASKEVIKVK